MKNLLLLALLCATSAVAQTTITVTITVPTAAGPVATAWILAQCPVPLVASACPTPPYASVQALVKSVVATAVQAQLQTIIAWAISTNDPSLPTPLKNAIASQQTANVTVAAAQAATNPTVQ